MNQTQIEITKRLEKIIGARETIAGLGNEPFLKVTDLTILKLANDLVLETEPFREAEPDEVIQYARRILKAYVATYGGSVEHADDAQAAQDFLGETEPLPDNWVSHPEENVGHRKGAACGICALAAATAA